YVDPLEHTPLHTLLVNSNRLQILPVWFVGFVILLNAGLVALIWLPRPDGAITLIAYIAAILACWGLLLGLRRTGRSFGPDRPTTIALAIALSVLSSILGFLGLPWWINVLALALIVGVVFYSTWVEPFQLGVTHQTYITDQWDASAPPLRLLQIGDIHVE